MAKNTRVILLEDIAGLGRAGDIVSVSDGYARNALFPNGQAALATEQETAKAQARQQADREAKEAELAKLHEEAQQLEGTELVLTARIKEGNDIFGKITAAQIAKELSAQVTRQFKPKDVVLSQPITKTGSYDITVKVSPEIEATIRVSVEGEAPAAESDE